MREIGVMLLLWCVLVGSALADTCLGTHAPCSLPCTATATASQILSVRSNRTELLVCNQDIANILYVILGQGTTLSGSAMTTNYGIPVPADTCLDLGVTPGPLSQLHTVTSDVWVITGGSTISCSYVEKAD